jgi:hypothetical protein
MSAERAQGGQAVRKLTITDDESGRSVEISGRVYELLATLVSADWCTDVAAVVETLIDHAQQGVYRPGAWERSWLMQAFGDDFLLRLEPDTEDTAADGRVIFDRPARSALT